MGQEVKKGSVGRFWLGVLHVAVVRCRLGLQTTETFPTARSLWWLSRGWQLVLAEAERSDENVHRITGKHAASPAQAASGQLGFQHGSRVPRESVPPKMPQRSQSITSTTLIGQRRHRLTQIQGEEHKLHSLEVLKNLGLFFLNCHIPAVCRILPPWPKALWLELAEALWLVVAACWGSRMACRISETPTR